MNMQQSKQRLLDLETTVSARIAREADQGHGQFIDPAHDVGDTIVQLCRSWRSGLMRSDALDLK
jgi:hypothetical protein